MSVYSESEALKDLFVCLCAELPLEFMIVMLHVYIELADTLDKPFLTSFC